MPVQTDAPQVDSSRVLLDFFWNVELGMEPGRAGQIARCQTDGTCPKCALSPCGCLVPAAA